MIECPSCRGAKKVGGIGCGPGGCKPLVLDCSTCGGVGQITEERVEWMATGKRLREERLARDLGLRAEAERLGIKPSMLSDYEHGRLNPAECPR